MFITGRNGTDARMAAAKIRRASGHQEVTGLALDLGSFASIRNSAAEWRGEARSPLRALVCNAGVHVVNGTRRTADGRWGLCLGRWGWQWDSGPHGETGNVR